MPSGVRQVRRSRSPLTSFDASASHSDRVGRSLSPMRERVRRPPPTGEAGAGGRFPSPKPERGSAGLGQPVIEGGLDRGLQRSAGPGDTGAPDPAGAGVEAPVAPRSSPATGAG